MVIRQPDDLRDGGGTFGSNLQKKLKSAPVKSGLPKIDLRPTGSPNTPLLVDKVGDKKEILGNVVDIVK